MLRYQDFLSKVVDESIDGATKDYGGREDDVGKAKLRGAVAGLKACRDLSPPQLAKLLVRAIGTHQKAVHKTNKERYWWINCFRNEVEWICNVISCVLINEGIHPIIQPTEKAAHMAARITQEAMSQLN
jgi:hypothetical protein